jgi:tRNA-Thr(GGU) m(6)t(6)A37 methyltransferase TsaA
MKIEFTPIGVIHTPFKTTENMPIQPAAGQGIEGTVEVFRKYQPALQDLDGFSHIILLYHLHLSKSFKLKVVPFLDTEPRGLFATRAPRRPNPIGISMVQLDRIEKNILYIRNVDILDGTPLLDIKPYVPEFDSPEKICIGWLQKVRKNITDQKSDSRFK